MAWLELLAMVAMVANCLLLYSVSGGVDHVTVLAAQMAFWGRGSLACQILYSNH